MKYSINAAAAPEPMGPYSQATTAGRLVFTSGLLAVAEDDPETLIEGNVSDQANRILDLVEILLAEVDCDLTDVAKTTVYLADLGELLAVDKVLKRRFPSPAPARSVVGVTELPLGALIEMDCVACR